MPMSTMIGSDAYYICTYCGNAFRDPKLAFECEQHCTQHHKADPELTAKAAKCPC